MQRKEVTFFARELPTEIKQIILQKIRFKALLTYRTVNTQWCYMIDSLLFDEELRHHPNAKVAFYVPVYETLQLGRLQSWCLTNSNHVPRYFYRSKNSLFTNTRAKACYKVMLSLDDIKQKDKKLQIDFFPRRYYLQQAVPATEIVVVCIRENEKEEKNPFYKPIIPDESCSFLDRVSRLIWGHA